MDIHGIVRGRVRHRNGVRLVITLGYQSEKSYRRRGK